MKLNKNQVIIVTALFVSLLLFISNPYKLSLSKYNFSLGQISDREIIAPFDFNIFKNSANLKADQDKAAANTHQIYRVSENLKFNAQKNLDFIFQHFNISQAKNDTLTIRNKLRQNGYELSLKSVQQLVELSSRQMIYEYLTVELSRIFNIGIYPANLPASSIKLSRNNETKRYKLDRLYSIDEAKTNLISHISGTNKKQLISELAEIVLIENIVIDKELTKQSKEEAKTKVSLITGKVKKNEMILDKNQKITQIELDKLESLKQNLQETQNEKSFIDALLSSLGAFMMLVLLLLFLRFLISQIFPEEYSSFSSIIIICVIFLGTALIAFVANNLLKVPSLYIPMLLPVLLISVLYDIKLGLIYSLLNFLLFALCLNWNFQDPLLYTLTAVVGLTILNRMKKQQNYYHLTIYLFLAFAIFSIAISLTKFEDFAVIGSNLLSGLTSIIIAMVSLSVLTPVIERKLNMATKQILLELLDFDNPLLKKISVAIPGTYHHALIVGNLAESAAEAIGANHLLTRVASYYHDIGKLENAQFFIENNPDSSQLHGKLLPNQSALLIKKHINDGIALAQKYNLPRQVIHILQQHHGTGFIRYFLNKVKEENLSFDESDFCYDGPKPQSKEAAIVMIADIVESTTKSLHEIEPKIIDKVIRDTVNNLIYEGQLDEAPITLAELDKIKKAMAPILNGVYNKRIEYPKNDNHIL